MQNLYGDKLPHSLCGYGVDIASQRADDLDQKALVYIAARNTETKALDLACGQGGQAIRMAAAGARVVASDLIEYNQELMRAASHGRPSLQFIKEDMRLLPGVLVKHQPFDLIVCQRAIHYLPYHQAKRMVGNLWHMLNPKGRLYLSASGIESELGQGYEPSPSGNIESRFATLAAEMVSKHGIHGPVCLYGIEDAAKLMYQHGFTVLEAFASDFGNVKIIAERES